MRISMFAAAAILALTCIGTAYAASHDGLIGTDFDKKGIEPVFAEKNELIAKKDFAVLFFDHSRRIDVDALAAFLNGCGEYAATNCFMVDGADSDPESIRTVFADTALRKNIYASATGVDMPMPYAVFVEKGEITGLIERQSDFSNKTGIYLSHMRGEITNAEMERALNAVDSEIHHRRIIPRMNFVMMLIMKGQKESALKEMAKIDLNELTAEEKTIVGEAYLRLREPGKAAEVLQSCDNKSISCLFYLGIAHYLLGEFDQAREMFIRVRPDYEDKESIDAYLDKIEQAQGN